MTSRVPSQKELVHEHLGDRFRESLSAYDTERRVKTLIGDFLGSVELRGKRTLDVGCGLGYFSQQLADRGADHTACDLGEGLVQKTVQVAHCRGVVADALRLVDQFGENAFDVVVSSECIEHTPEPLTAVAQMCKVLKPGGLISLSTPNIVWWPVVKAASILKFRPFDGYENFSTFRRLRRTFRQSGVEVLREKGLHLFPFQLPLHALSSWCDEHLQFARGLMINLCILGRKHEP